MSMLKNLMLMHGLAGKFYLVPTSHTRLQLINHICGERLNSQCIESRGRQGVPGLVWKLDLEKSFFLF